MPLFNWSVVILGQTEAADQEKLEQTLKNQVSYSVNVAASVAKVVVSSQAQSGLTVAGQLPADLKNRGAGG
jgi:hypothetical protein